MLSAMQTPKVLSHVSRHNQMKAEGLTPICYGF